MERVRIRYAFRMVRTFCAQRRFFASTRDWLAFGRLRLASGGKSRQAGIPVPIRPRGFQHPVILRPGTTDYSVFREIFIDGEYDCLLRRLNIKINTILDLGANIGLFAAYAHHHFKDARIVAVEPEEQNAVALASNVAVMAGPSRVTILRACAAGSSRYVALASTSGEWGFRMVESVNGDGGVIAMRVPEILEGAGIPGEIDLLKCDVEGAEKEIFANCSDWIFRVRNIVAEIHSPYSVGELQTDLARNGGRLQVIELAEHNGLPSLVFLHRAE